MQVERGDYQNRIHVLAGQQFAVIKISLGIRAGRLDALLQVEVPVVAQRDTPAHIGFLQVLEQIGAAAAGADHAVLHLVVGGAHFLDEWETFHGSGNGCDRCGSFYKIAAGDVVFLGHRHEVLR